jgi:LPS-assembly lipoprotein
MRTHDPTTIFNMAARARMRLLRIAALTLALGASASCGYQPLYGERGAAGESAAADLATVRIVPIAERGGQMLYNALLDRLNPAGRPGSPRFVLEVRLSEGSQSIGVRRDEIATRANLLQTARFELRDAQSDVVLFRGAAEATMSYNIVQQRYASLVAEGDARQRGVDLLADDIRLQIALYMNRRRAAAAPGSAPARP